MELAVSINGLYSLSKEKLKEAFDSLVSGSAIKNEWHDDLYIACYGSQFLSKKKTIAYHLKHVEKIIEKANCRCSDYDLNLGLFGACEAGCLDLVTLLLSYGASNMDCGLYGACRGGHVEMVSLMIEKGATDWDGGLRGACWGEHRNLIKMMIHLGAANLYDASQFAFQNNDQEMIDLLLNAKDHSVCLEVGLEQACFKNDYKLLEKMIDRGANNWDDGLRMAVEGNHPDMVIFMINNGAQNLKLAGDFAVRKNHQQIAILLIEVFHYNVFTNHQRQNGSADSSDDSSDDSSEAKSDHNPFKSEADQNPFKSSKTHSELSFKLKSSGKSADASSESSSEESSKGSSNSKLTMFESLKNPTEIEHSSLGLACFYGRYKLVRWVMEHNDLDWNSGLIGACLGFRNVENVSSDTEEFFYRGVADLSETRMNMSIWAEIMDDMILFGATNFDQAIKILQQEYQRINYDPWKAKFRSHIQDLMQKVMSAEKASLRVS